MSDPTPTTRLIFNRVAAAELDGVLRITFPAARVDGVAVREFFEAVTQLVHDARARLLVDFTGIDMITSGMMGMLVTIKKRCMRYGAQIHLAIPDAEVRRTFELMNLHLILSIFTSPTDALAAFKPD